jgi:single-strand DNA-binding protein
MLNSVTLIGRLVADPQHRMTQTGKGVANLRVAVDRKGREKESDFFDVTAWGQTADFVCTYLSKGRLVAIQGRLQVRTYNDKEGAERKAFEIVADTVQPLDSNKNAAPQGAPAGKPAPSMDAEITDPFAD